MQLIIIFIYTVVFVVQSFSPTIVCPKDRMGCTFALRSLDTSGNHWVRHPQWVTSTPPLWTPRRKRVTTRSTKTSDTLTTISSLNWRTWKAWKSATSCPKQIAPSVQMDPMWSWCIQDDFWRGICPSNVWVLFPPFFVLTGKSQWQAQYKPKRRETRTQTLFHQPRSYELHAFFFKVRRWREW